MPRSLAVICASIALSLALAAAATAGAKSTFYIRGAGNGHGVGMSQYGAYGYALHGKDYRWILAHYYRGTTLASANPNQTVRVLVSTGSSSKAFSGAAHAGSKRLNPALTYTVQPLRDGSLKLIDHSGKKVGIFQPPLVITGPGPVTLAATGTYRGALVFRPDGSGGVQTVNALGLDDYVRGVVSWEMPAGWATEALKVQAVAARTFAITAGAAGADFDLFADTRSQMYGGVAAETPVTDAAVAATTGQIVTYRGAPAITYFSASSGGHTENVENVWPRATPEPWLRGVPDPYDDVAGNPYHRWGYDLSLDVAASKLGSLVRGKLIGIQVVKHGVSERIVAADVVGTKGRTRVAGSELQQVFGLRSTWAVFTTITTVPAMPAALGTLASFDASVRSGDLFTDIGLQARKALMPLVNDLVGGTPAGLRGTVFPAPPAERTNGATVAIQVSAGHRWRTLTHARLGAGGTYAVTVPAPGTYRVVYRGLDGPAVSVS